MKVLALALALFIVSTAHADCVEVNGKQYCEVATVTVPATPVVASPPVVTCAPPLVWNGAQWVCPVYVYQQSLVNPIVGIAVGAAALYWIGHGGFNGGHRGQHRR